MPQLAEAPRLKLVSNLDTHEIDPALEPVDLAEIANRSALYAHDLSEEVLAGSEPSETDVDAIKELADVSLRSMNTLLISNPNLLNHEIEPPTGGDAILVRDILNDTLADLDPDPAKNREARNVTDITSPLGLSIAVRRALEIINDNKEIYKKDNKTKSDYYRLLGRISSGSLDALALLNTGIKDIEKPSIQEATTEVAGQNHQKSKIVKNSPELNERLEEAVRNFRKIEKMPTAEQAETEDLLKAA